MSLFTAGLQPALDSNGNPISAATWNFYRSGGLTAAAVYSSPALTTSLGTSLTANAAGRFSIAYLDDAIAYRAILKDAAGVTIKDIDPYTEEGVFQQSGTGAAVRSIEAKLREIEISVADSDDLVNDGTADDTAAFQWAHDQLPNGGVIKVPRSANAYRVSKVNITNPYITFRLEEGATLKKYGSAGSSSRGMFAIENFLNAHFSLEGRGIVDLNGEGPTGIGVAGRIANDYIDHTVTGIKGINGPVNSAIFALRASHIIVRDVFFKNSAENAILFRNCSDTTVENIRVENVANYGVEYSVLSSGTDGGTGTLPDLARHAVRDSVFTDITDYALGTGNGCGVGGGGSGPPSNPKGFEITGCKFTRCQRDINLEIPTGSEYFEGGRIDIESFDVLQGSIGLLNCKGFTVNAVIRNPGAAPTAALANDVVASNWPEIYGVLVGRPNSDDNQINVDVIDDRNTKVYRGTDGQITAGDATFTSATAAFVAADVGRWLGIVGAGPSGIVHQARIASLNGAAPTTSVELEYPAVTSVSGAKYAYGGALRRGVVINAGGDVTITGRIKGGIASGLTGAPDAAGLYIDGDVSGRVDAAGLQVLAPTTLGTVPAGVLLEGALTGSGRFRPGAMRVRGFTELFKNTRLQQSSVESRTYRSRGLTANPSATIDTYGTTRTFTPNGSHWDMLTGLSLTVASIGAETVTISIKAYYYDNGDDEILKTSTTNQTITLTPDELAQIMRDNTPVRLLEIRSKSSTGSSTATVTIAFLAVGS